MKKIALSLLFFITTVLNFYSQNSLTINCGSDQYRKELQTKHPDLIKKEKDVNDQIYQQLKNITGSQRGPIRVVPVVVHIIHNNGPENITNAQVLQGIQHLNDAFRNTGTLNDPNGVDTEIEFCLAQRDPNGNATVGITRTVSPLTSMVMENDDAALKNIIRWNPTLYLNIWLVKDITSTVNGSGVSGYATMPSSHGQNDDGIVNEAYYFGSSPNNSKVHIHEAGHYLGLFHTFEGGCANNNCLTDGDLICDTPPDNSTANFTCGTTPNTCNTDDDDLSVNNPFRPIANGGLGDQSDLIENHMDYGDVLCHTLFTNGQKNRMQAAITGPRASLLQSIACTSPCTNPITLNFTANTTTIGIGGTVNFNNTTTGATSFNWTINNNSFATTQNSSNTFNTAGSFWVVLTANNNDPNCIKQDSILIKVKCNVTSKFTSSPVSFCPGGSVTFTSTSTGATTYQWFVDGIPQVTTPTFNYTFNTAGGYNVYLVACNAICCDTSKFQLIAVGTCLSKEANVWCFGYNAMWDFASGNPLPVVGSAMRAEEAASSICDKNGNLLMYCDGERLYNKNHVLMQNGMYLFGHKSSSMGALIVPQPGSATNYYVFTGDAQLGGQNVSYGPSVTTTFPPGAISYNIVDITQAGGLGAVTLKNQVLTTNSTEKLVGIKHSNGTDIWIVTHEYGSNKFHSNLLTCTGLDTIPVISASGVSHTDPPNQGNTNSMGMMMISPNGKKIAVVTRNSGTQLGDFNTTTGVISNLVSINPPSMLAQGCAFSPDSKILYTTATEFSGLFNGVYQYNITLGSAAAITASIVKLPTNNASVYCGMQLAPNGKIYIAELNGTALHVINNPNALGAAANLTVNTVPLNAGGTSRFTVPNFLVDYMSPKKASKINGPTVICTNTTYYIKNNCGLSNDSLAWILNGNSIILSAVDSSVTIKPSATSSIDTLISVQYSSCGVVTDTLIIQAGAGNLVALGNDTTICGAINLTLNAGAGFTSYLWSTTATSQTINVTSPGTYWVQVTSGPCISTDTIVVTQVTSSPSVNLGTNKTVCPGNVVQLNAGAGYASYTWQDNSHNQTFTAYNPGTYWVTVTDYCGNTSSDTIQVLPNLAGAINLGNDTVLCSMQAFNLSPGNGYLNYDWSTTDSISNISVTTTGTYWVEVTDSLGCTYKDTITITMGNGPILNLGNDTSFCNFTSMPLNAGSNFASYLWSTTATTSSITATAVGVYWVQVTDSAGCISADTITLSLGNVNLSTGPALILTCTNSSGIITANSIVSNASYAWSGTGITSGVNNDTATVNTAGTYTVTITDPSNGCTNTATVTVTSNITSIPFSQNITLCNGNSLQVGTSTYNSSGQYIDTLTAANGCDSIVTSNLTILQIHLAYKMFLLVQILVIN